MKPGYDYIGVSVGALIINTHGHILLAKRSNQTRNEQGKWEAPGGAVHIGETREEAIKREIHEELGIEVAIDHVLHVVDEILTEQKQHWVATTFLVHIIKNGKPQICEPHKCDAIGWFPLTKLPSPVSYITSVDIDEYTHYRAHKIS